uniref:C-type lectin domain-containing protein n=1 Tax=Sinocyclocheilus anshuiensis TaxID=1608454 RepID=A0A671P1R0_9TELE
MSYYGNMNIPGTHGMGEDEEEMNIYANADAHDARTEKENSDTKRHQTPRHTGTETHFIITTNTHILVILVLRNIYLHIGHLQEASEQLQCVWCCCVFFCWLQSYVEENEELIVKLFLFTDQSCLYYFSSEKKSWTESRKYCREKGADLIIINNREEQVSEIYFWIGLTDSDEEGTWKWVDGSTLTSGTEHLIGHRRENCALTVVGEWADHPCTEEYNWMCEKRKM